MTAGEQGLVALAGRCEKASGPDRRLDALISDATDRPDANDPDRNLAIHQGIVQRILAGGDDCEIERYTASLDAAMTLSSNLPKEIGGGHGLTREAMDRLSRRFSLHAAFWPAEKSYCEWLARYITAAALRAIALRDAAREREG